jgi:hypothetical protein
MRLRWRLRDMMATVAVLAIYLAAFDSLRLSRGGGVVTLAQQVLAILLLFCIMPFHVMAVWARFIARNG